MTLAAFALGLALAALPYPPPRLLQPTSDTKCDWGPVAQVDARHGELVLETPAGLATYKVAPEIQVVGKDGRPAGAPSSLTPGTRVRVYYVLADGAKVQEIDLQ